MKPTLEHALAFDKVPQANHDNYSMLSNDLIRKLSKQSKGRRESSKEFTQLQSSIDDYVKQKERKGVPLNEKKFLALQDEAENRRKEMEKTTRRR